MILHPFRVHFTLLCVAALAWPTVLAQNLSSSTVSLVESRLAQSAKARCVFSANHSFLGFAKPISISCSWELGTRAQALLELNAPSYSVLSPQPLPPSPQVPLNLTDSMNTVFSIAHNVVANRTISNGNITGPQPLINDTSAGDPASIGIAVLLASYTGQWAKDGLNYAGAAQDQLDFLFEAVPHTSDGAISHLVHEVQLWVRCLLLLSLSLCVQLRDDSAERLRVHGAAFLGLLRGYISKCDHSLPSVQPNKIIPKLPLRLIRE
jgi:hypothetical protein